MTPSRPRDAAAGRLSLVLDVLIAGALAVTVLVALNGGLQFRAGSVRISAHDVARPLLVSLALIAIRLWRARKTSSADLSAMTARIGFIALFGVVFSTWLILLVTVCGGADSYGYVSASRLIRSFRLSYVEPIAGYLPLADPVNAVAPLGYRPGGNGATIVPTYPIGLPVVMAFLGTLFGDGAEFYVSPLLGLLAAMVAYRIASAFTDRIGAALSALFVAVTPIFVNQAIQPMSDVAATFWLLLALMFVVREPGTTLDWVLASAAAGMAFMTRPALVGAVAVLVVIALVFRGWRAAAICAAGLLPFGAFQAWLHWHLYGAVLSSGYGGAAYLFTIDRVPRNLWVFFRWVSYSASPLFAVVLALGAFAFGSMRWWAAALALLAGVAAPYLFYFTYDDWQATRFLLPGIAVAMIVCGVTIRNLSMRWLPRSAAVVMVLAIAWIAAAASYRFLHRQDTFTLARLEAKYPQVGEWIAASAPRNTVVFAFLHSGSVRFYAGRPTARWDQLSAAELGTAVAALKAKGWESWAVIDGPDEAAAFWPRLEEAQRALTMDPKGNVQGVQIVALRPR